MMCDALLCFDALPAHGASVLHVLVGDVCLEIFSCLKRFHTIRTHCFSIAFALVFVTLHVFFSSSVGLEFARA